MENYFNSYLIINSISNLDNIIEETLEKIKQKNIKKNIIYYDFSDKNLKKDSITILLEYLNIDLSEILRIIIIKNVEYCSNSIIQIFLKTIEFSKKNVIFFFTTKNKDLILKTLLSRCIIINYNEKQEESDAVQKELLKILFSKQISIDAIDKFLEKTEPNEFFFINFKPVFLQELIDRKVSNILEIKNFLSSNPIAGTYKNYLRIIYIIINKSI
jgi:hypothetical protein